jgi:predicted Zn-dependent protease
MINYLTKLAVTLAFVMMTTCAFAEPIDSVRYGWAQAKYELNGKEQAKAFDSVLKEIQILREEKAEPEALLDCWEGTTLSSYASQVGGTKGLSMVKKAKALLESSIMADDTVEDGLALGVLGTLYYKVPSWPLGFHDDKKAKKFLKKAVARDPQGAHSNYYYGEYLATKKDNDNAALYLNTALKASEGSSDVVAHGRQHDIQFVLNAMG